MDNRRDLLLEAEHNKPPEDKNKLASIIDEGMTLQNLIDSRGWKLLYDKYIRPNTLEDKWLDAPRETAEDIRIEVRVLRRLLQFIDKRIEAAKEAVNKIHE